MSAKKNVEATGPPKDVAAYLSAPYIHMIIPNAEEGGYLAEILELPGCITEGDTPEEAYRNLEDAMGGYIAAALDTKRLIPDPVGDKEYSGHFPLRISTELHRAAALRAIQEEVSLNQWIARAIAAQVAKDSLVENLADELARKVVERISVDVTAGLRFRVGGMEDVGAPGPSEVIRTRLELATPDAFTNVYTNLVGGFRDVAPRPVERIEHGKEVAKDA